MPDHAYTDRHGYPLTAIEAARRAANSRSQGFYHNGRWIRRKPKPKEVPSDQVQSPRRPANG